VRFGDAVEGPGVVVTREGNLADAEGRCGASLAAFTIWGRHNRRNAAAAAAAALAAGTTWAEVAAGAVATRPLRHRLEPVAEAGGVLFVDDSIATTPESAIAALEATPRKCVILVGGKDKGADLSPLVAAVAARARAAVGIGTTGRSLVEAVRRASETPAEEGGPDLRSAVETAMRFARPGDAVLLSPGCSSLDQYVSFEARGDRFAEAARSLPGAASARA
jgi:UDP-N-acetylmuramoylalanine--D-glutamate ligase